MAQVKDKLKICLRLLATSHRCSCSCCCSELMATPPPCDASSRTCPRAEVTDSKCMYLEAALTSRSDKLRARMRRTAVRKSIRATCDLVQTMPFQMSMSTATTLSACAEPFFVRQV